MQFLLLVGTVILSLATAILTARGVLSVLFRLMARIR